MNYKKNLFVLLFCFGRFLYAPPYSDREVSLSEILTQYKLKNFSETLKLMNRVGKLTDSQKLALNYTRAHSYFQLKEYNNALDEFLKLLPDVPYKYEIYNNLGACYFYIGDYKNSLYYFNLSKTENPNYKIAEKNYILLQNAISAKNLEKLEATRENFPDTFLVVSSASADISTGWIYFYLGKSAEAIHLFKNAIKSDPGYSLSYLSLGYLYDSSGNFKSAIRYYKSALKIDPDYPDIWNNLGISYYNDGQIENSILHFEKAIQLNPTFAYPVNNLGFIYIQKDDFSKAKKYFLRSIELKPSEPFLLGETYAGLSICNYHLLEWNKAKENKKRSIELNFNLSKEDYLRKELRWKEKIIDIFLNQIDKNNII